MDIKLPARSPSTYFLLVFALAVPFWILGIFTNLQLLPGLPVAALAFICPSLAASILTYRESGAAGLAALLKSPFDFRKVERKFWYLPTLLIMPIIMALSFVVLRLSGVSVPSPQFGVLHALLLLLLFFVGALGEEIGWSGYVIDPMQERWGGVWAAVFLGSIWAVYHYVGLVEAHRPASWIAWWSLGTVALRVIMVWLYDNTNKSVFVVSLFHAMINVTWQLFPVNGSYYDPRTTGSITATAAVVVVLVWRSGLRSRYSKI